MVVIPVYPIKVILLEYGEEYILKDELAICTELEFFDSEDTEEKSIVTDALGKSVILVVDYLEIKTFKLK